MSQPIFRQNIIDTDQCRIISNNSDNCISENDFVGGVSVLDQALVRPLSLVLDGDQLTFSFNQNQDIMKDILSYELEYPRIFSIREKDQVKFDQYLITIDLYIMLGMVLCIVVMIRIGYQYLFDLYKYSILE